MKISKQRLKEIIKEELSSINEGDPQIALHDLENQLMDLKQSVLTFIEPYDAGLGHEVGAALAAALEDTLSMVNNTLVEVERAAGEASELEAITLNENPPPEGGELPPETKDDKVARHAAARQEYEIRALASDVADALRMGDVPSRLNYGTGEIWIETRGSGVTVRAVRRGR